ncbi:MAG: hypothetical protein ABI411_10345 [Tahibacter sp.]
MRIELLALVLGGLLAQAGVVTAAAPSASGSIVINGKTVMLTQGRAWKSGESMGVPMLDIMLAEKSLAGLNWWKGTDNFAEGQRGVVLRLKPNNSPTDKRDQATFHYLFDEDYQVSLYAGDFRQWNEAALTKDDVAISDLSVTKGVVSGKLAWKGKLDNPYEETQNITAWTATFSLPLEEVGPMPAN